MSSAIVSSTPKSYSGFSPTTIPSCLVWLDAADTSSIAATGTTVTQWNDKSGNANHMTAASSPKTGTITTNGLNTIDVTGGGYFTRTSFTFPATYSIFTVGYTSGTGLNTLISTSPDLVYLQRWNGFIWGNGGGSWNSFTATILSTSLMLTETFNTGGTTTASMYTDGNLIETKTAGTTSTGSQIAIGNRLLTLTEAWNGYLCEVLIFTSALTTFQRQQIEGYLTRKWGLTGNILDCSSFTPTSISNCTLWLDAADASTFTLSGSNVTQWRDKSGGGFHANATSTPTRSTYNGYSVVSFDGSSQFMTSTHTIPRATHTLIAVHRPVTITGNSQGNTSLFRYQGTNNYVVFPYMNATTPRGYITNAGTTGTNATSSTLLENSITTAFNLIMAVIGTGSQVIFRNGARQSSTTQTFTTTPVSDALTIGRFPSGASEYYQGDLAEMIVFSRAITTSERTQIEEYLSWKWRVNIRLPATHPYKSLPLSTRPFQPSDIESCMLWLDSSDLNTFTLSGTNVSQWRDKSGNGYNLTQGTAGSQPLLTSGYVSFASDRFLNIPQAAINNATTYSIFLVINPISSTNWIMAKQHNGVNTYNLLSMTRTSTSSGLNTLGVTNYLYWRPYNLGASPNSGTALSTSTVQLLELVYDGTNIIMYRNGTQLSSTSATAGTGAIQNATAATNFTMGAWIADGTIQNTGVTNFQLGEMLFFNTAFTTSQRQQMEGYLAWKWGLQSALPATQPFKLFRTPTVLFSPLQISGCTLWLDATDISTQTLSGSTVTRWNDKSGGGFNATATAGPTRSTYNGYSVLSFDGSTNTMISTHTIPRATHTLIAIHRPATITGNFQGNTSLFRYQTGGDYIIFPYMDATAARGYVTLADGTPINANNSTLLENSVTTSLNLITAVIASGSQIIYKNGTQQNSNTQTLSTTAFTATLVIGSISTTTQFYQGDVAEMIVYSRNLTLFERQQMEGYLAWKWGLQALLSSSHPYYDTRA